MIRSLEPIFDLHVHLVPDTSFLLVLDPKTIPIPISFPMP
jgi:hypothetical protein